MSVNLKEKDLQREKFIENNLGLVHSCANRFRGKGIEYEEMYAAGCVGLVKAYDAFDTGRGVQFSTYAVPVILGEIKKLFRDGGMVKVTRSIKELSLKVNYARDALQKKLGQEPTLREIAAELGVPVEEIARAVSAATPPMSLTAAFEDEDGQSEFDIPIESAEEELTNMMGLKYAISDLDSEEKKIIYLRFFKSMTQAATARQLGKTQVQISRKERKIIQKMRKRFME
ncbi:MAG: sigma-70 family RNA polymerase sigma factor [Oscillospiraceae bacterium]|nr:sigma-70 family RNA polymerase sigma factor [Oscillospiraceae bacterium]